jgi:hypothetical protein
MPTPAPVPISALPVATLPLGGGELTAVVQAGVTSQATTADIAAIAAGDVTSVFGRVGVVTAQSGDYDAGQISGLGSAALEPSSAFDAAGSAAAAQAAAEAASQPRDSTLTAISGAGTDGTGAVVLASAISRAFHSGRVKTPVATISLSLVQMGLAQSITPLSSGNVLVIISGNVENTTPGDGAQYQISFGTGIAPANGVPATGTTAGEAQTLTSVTVTGGGVASAMITAFTLTAILTGLTVGVAAWVDVQLKCTGGGSANIFNVEIELVEL